MTIMIDAPANPAVGLLNSLELEITAACQHKCLHCLSESSPQAGHGTMTREDWLGVIADAASLDVKIIQLIGGEPTLNPDWRDYVELALALNCKVEVYSNLYHVSSAWWPIFELDGVSLGTSYYSDQAAEHEEITQRPGSFQRTRRNIREAVRRGIDVRAGIVHVLPEQRVVEARTDLESLGVKQIQTDRVRAVGRAAEAQGVEPTVKELCGRCGQGRAAILPNGDLSLCVLSRFMPCANVKERPLTEILGSPAWVAAVKSIPERPHNACTPNDSGDCDPASTEACDPAY